MFWIRFDLKSLVKLLTLHAITSHLSHSHITTHTHVMKTARSVSRITTGSIKITGSHTSWFPNTKILTSHKPISSSRPVLISLSLFICTTIGFVIFSWDSFLDCFRCLFFRLGYFGLGLLRLTLI